MKYFVTNKYRGCAKLAALISVVLFGSCKKLIEIPPNPPGKVSTERVYSDSLNVLGALTGIYANFSTGGFGTIITANTALYTGMAADELTPNPLIGESQISTNNILANNIYIASLWNSGYASIYQANAFLEGVAASTGLSDSFKLQVTAEALIARSLCYFHLVNQFGELPIITGTDFKVNSVEKRKPVDSVYAMIIADLNRAVNQLTLNYPSPGRVRPNINTAKAFLAKVYLYRQQWQQAADLSDQVIKSGPFLLVPPANVFLSGSAEAIWQLPVLNSFGGVSDAMVMLPWDNTSVPNYFFSDNLKNAFEPQDLRKEAWVGTSLVTSGGTTTEYLYPFKYKDRNSPGGQDYMMFRLADQILIRSEALAHLDMLDSARSGINAIRERAGLDPTIAVSQEEVLAAIEKERYIEFFCEAGNRWYDLKRTNRLNAVLEPIKPEWADTDALFPIPSSELQNNNHLTQNEGY